MITRFFGKRVQRPWKKALSHTGWLALGLLWGTPYGCTSTDCNATLSCPIEDPDSDDGGGERAADDMGGEAGAGGSGSSSGGRAPASGGKVASLGGEGGNVGSGGKAHLPSIPEIVSVTVGGEPLEAGGRVAGVEAGAQIVFRFSEPMQKGPTQTAYGSRSSVIKNANVTFKWNADTTELTIIPDEPLSYFETEDPLTSAPTYDVRLSTVARSITGQELDEDFEASFSLLRRVSYFVPLDGTNSVFSADPAATTPEDIPVRALPYKSAPWFYCNAGWDPLDETEVIEELGYESPSYDQVLVGYTANLGEKNIGVMSFSLSGIDAVEVESAKLRLLKWRNATGNTDYWEQSADARFSVDALHSQTLTLETLSSASLRSNLVSSDGDAFPLGYGLFSFDVKGLIRAAVDQGDAWAMYRLEFDGSADWDVEAGEYSSMCAGLALTIQYLAE